MNMAVRNFNIGAFIITYFSSYVIIIIEVDEYTMVVCFVVGLYDLESSWWILQHLGIHEVQGINGTSSSTSVLSGGLFKHLGWL